MGHTRVYVKGVLDAEEFPIADVSDHLARVDSMVWVDLCDPSKAELDELAAELGLHELAVEGLSLRDYRANQIMKLVTSWAAIIAVPTLITGWYGMNVPYPGSGETWGVWAAAALVIVLSAGLFVLFRRRNWL